MQVVNIKCRKKYNTYPVLNEHCTLVVQREDHVVRMAKESLSVKIAPVLKHPRYFWSRGLQRDITCQPFEFLSVSLHLSRSFIDAGVRDCPDVGLDHSQNWLVLVGKVRLAGGSSLNTVHVCHTVGRSLNGINRVPLPFPRFFTFFLIELALVLTEEIF